MKNLMLFILFILVVPHGLFSQEWSEFQRLTDILPNQDDEYGISVSCSSGPSMEYVVVGAHCDNDMGYNSGSVFIYKFDGGSWQLEAQKYASDPSETAHFGHSVSMFSDHSIVVGAHLEDSYATNAGAAYIFMRDGSDWNEIQKLQPNDIAAGDVFGKSVDIYGNFLVVGAPNDDDLGTNSGSAYVFERDINTDEWMQVAKLTASDGNAEDNFGESVSIYDSTIVIAAPYDDPVWTDQGSVYVYKNDGSSWNEQIKLIDDFGLAGDKFGSSIDIYENHIIVGATLADNCSNANAGSAFIYIWDNNANIWSFNYQLWASDADTSDQFGVSVAIDEHYAVVGSQLNDVWWPNQGATYIFRKLGFGWVEDQKLYNQDGYTGDNFGHAISLDDDNLVISAFHEDSWGEYSGAAYVYEKLATGFVENAKIQSVQIYPNPAHDMINIATQFKLSPENKMYIYDINGKELMSQELSDPLTRIDVRRFTPGCYAVKIMTDEQFIVEKFIKH